MFLLENAKSCLMALTLNLLPFFFVWRVQAQCKSERDDTNNRGIFNYSLIFQASCSCLLVWEKRDGSFSHLLPFSGCFWLAVFHALSSGTSFLSFRPPFYTTSHTFSVAELFLLVVDALLPLNSEQNGLYRIYSTKTTYPQMTIIMLKYIKCCISALKNCSRFLILNWSINATHGSLCAPRVSESIVFPL